MIFDNSIEKNEESLLMLDESLPQVTADRFIYGLQQRKWKELDVVQFTISVRNSHSFAMIENVRLKKWGETFNEEYATDHNTYFSTAERTMNRIKSTLSGIKKAVTKLCYTSKKQLPANADAPTVYERSPLFKGDYSPDLFGLDSYGQSVNTLYEELISYLKTADENVSLCIEVIDRENYIRQHPEECVEVHDRCYDITFNHSQRIIKRLKESDADIDNDILKAIEDAENTQQAIVELFHMLNVDQWTDYVICRATIEAKKAGLDTIELQLWGRENSSQVMRVRKLLAHLGELEMKKVKRGGALSGYFLMRLFYWCKIKDNSKHALLLEYVKAHYNGLTVAMGAVKAEKKKLTYISNKENQDQQSEFNSVIDEFLSRI